MVFERAQTVDKIDKETRKQLYRVGVTRKADFTGAGDGSLFQSVPLWHPVRNSHGLRPSNKRAVIRLQGIRHKYNAVHFSTHSNIKLIQSNETYTRHCKPEAIQRNIGRRDMAGDGKAGNRNGKGRAKGNRKVNGKGTRGDGKGPMQ